MVNVVIGGLHGVALALAYAAGFVGGAGGRLALMWGLYATAIALAVGAGALTNF